MKNFLTSMLGALVALIIFVAGAALLCVGIAGAVVALAGKKTAPVEAGSYLVFNLATNITDAPPLIDWAGFDGRDASLQLRTATRALHVAARDPRIHGLLLLGSLSPNGYGTGYAALKEVRAAIADFKAAGKPVTAYLDFATTKDFYLASAASRVVLNPYGVIAMPGLASEPVFFAGAFEKYGIGVQVTRVGKYKSFVEPFIRKDMSPENREQVLKLLDDVWGSLIADIGRSRGITPARIQATVDAEGLIRPEAAMEAHLVDRIAYRDEIAGELKAQTGAGRGKDDFRQIGLDEYSKTIPSASTGGRVAVVYAEGDIVEGEGADGEVGGVKFARELRRLREDDEVKAIVLRVNSPGGSASAAETIQREIRLARKVKPVIVSMGSYAASGGYWISADADRIFAEPTTVTGSIGVFGIQFDVKRLANDFGITFDGVKTGKFADTFTIARPKTDEEMAVFQRLVDWIYGQFIAKVAEGRKLKPEFVEEIAQGRVWSGLEAKKLGLVDEIGGLGDSLRYAARIAGLGAHFRVDEYPRTKNLSEVLSEALGKVAPDSLHIHSTPGVVGRLERQIEAEMTQLRTFDDPQGVYARLPVGFDLK